MGWEGQRRGGDCDLIVAFVGFNFDDRCVMIGAGQPGSLTKIHKIASGVGTRGCDLTA